MYMYLFIHAYIYIYMCSSDKHKYKKKRISKKKHEKPKKRGAPTASVCRLYVTSLGLGPSVDPQGHTRGTLMALS